MVLRPLSATVVAVWALSLGAVLTLLGLGVPSAALAVGAQDYGASTYTYDAALHSVVVHTSETAPAVSQAGFDSLHARVATTRGHHFVSLAKSVAANSLTSVTRSLDDLGSLRGATPAEIRQLIPEGWTEMPLKTGSGTRFLNPERPGEALMIENGWPGATDPLHSGPYLRVSRDGTVTRVPLQGNPVLDQ